MVTRLHIRIFSLLVGSRGFSFQSLSKRRITESGLRIAEETISIALVKSQETINYLLLAHLNSNWEVNDGGFSHFC